MPVWDSAFRCKTDNEIDFDLALRQLREFYTPHTNAIVESLAFHQRAQPYNESTADFASALRGLAKTCAFCAMTDVLVRDVVVKKIVTTGAFQDRSTSA